MDSFKTLYSKQLHKYFDNNNHVYSIHKYPRYLPVALYAAYLVIQAIDCNVHKSGDNQKNTTVINSYNDYTVCERNIYKNNKFPSFSEFR